MRSTFATLHPNLPTGADFRAAVKEIGAGGAASLSFYPNGHKRLSALSTIAAALT